MGDVNKEWRSREVTDTNFTSGSGYSDDWKFNCVGDYTASLEAILQRSTQWETSLYGSMKDNVIVSAFAKIRDDTVMSGEILSDIGQSLSMLRRPFGGSVKLLKKCFSSAQRRYRKTTRSVTQANADAWLEYQYGWRPLFLDMRTGLRLYSESENRLKKARKVARASLHDSFGNTMSCNDATLTVPFLGTCKASGSVSQNAKFSAHGGVIYQIASRDQATALSEDLRLGADSLASTAWEVIPFSFVADWFIRVVPWLDAVNLPPSVSVIGNWVTCLYDLSYAHSGTFKWHNPYKNVDEIYQFGPSSHKQRGFTRYTNVSLPSYPPMEYRPLGVHHATSGLALLTAPILGLLDKLKH